MNFVNQYFSHTSVVCYQANMDISAEIHWALIITSIVIFILSMAFASVILFKGNKKEGETEKSSIKDKTKVNRDTAKYKGTKKQNIKKTTEIKQFYAKFKIFFKEIGGFCSKELRKLNKWKSIKNILPEKKPVYEDNTLKIKNNEVLDKAEESQKPASEDIASSIPSPPYVPDVVETAIIPPTYVSNLYVKPSSVYPGDTVIVCFNITSVVYTGDYYSISLKIGNATIYTIDIYLEPMETRELNWPLCAMTAGDWTVDVNGSQCKLVILEYEY